MQTLGKALGQIDTAVQFILSKHCGSPTAEFAEAACSIRDAMELVRKMIDSRALFTEADLKRAMEVLTERDQLVDQITTFERELGVTYEGNVKANLVVQRTDRRDREHHLKVDLSKDAFDQLTAGTTAKIEELNTELLGLGILTIDREIG